MDQKVIKTFFITGINPDYKGYVEPPLSNHCVDLPTDTDMANDGQDVTEDGAVAIDLSNNHLDRENSVNNVLPTTLLSRRHSSGFLEGMDPDKLDDKDENIDQSTTPFNEGRNAKRDLKDREMIDLLKADVAKLEFFYMPPVKKLTLAFNDTDLEEDYRNHYFDSQLFKEESVASPRYHAFIEMIISVVLFILISVCAFLVFYRSIVFVAVFSACLVIELLMLVDIVTDLKLGHGKKERCIGFAECMSSWRMRNFVGALLAILPAFTIYSNMSCELAEDDNWKDRFFCFCIITSLLNFCNFSMLISGMKSVLATIMGLILLVLLNVAFCDFSWTSASPAPPLNITTTTTSTTPNPATALSTITMLMNTTVPIHHTPVPDHLFSGENALRFEIILDILLILLLIWFLNREFEISYRLSFHGSAIADQDTQQMQQNKEQADWLLHNIIPEHVSDVVKRTSKYSKNHKDVGVIFATIINFNEFYDEGFEGGREYLRVLNELVSDYEDLLDRECFKDVEKIKTISSTFMAASGLNEMSRASNKHPNKHLFALMDFAVGLQNVVHNFNESIFNFNFVLNIGYNFGEVTAGVIGTTKLLYDIWGDTVNIASRMYSTGEPDRIQVPESTLEKLEEMFVFEYRGEIFVKGKGDMKCFLYKEKRPNASWD